MATALSSEKTLRSATVASGLAVCGSVPAFPPWAAALLLLLRPAVLRAPLVLAEPLVLARSVVVPVVLD